MSFPQMACLYWPTAPPCGLWFPLWTSHFLPSIELPGSFEPFCWVNKAPLEDQLQQFQCPIFHLQEFTRKEKAARNQPDISLTPVLYYFLKYDPVTLLHQGRHLLKYTKSSAICKVTLGTLLSSKRFSQEPDDSQLA